MSYLKNLIELIRVKQWYKNLLLFLALFFSGNVLNVSMVKLVVIGFFSFCFVSSVNYIINDLIDSQKDQNHPEKKNRPLASGKISRKQAIVGIIFFAALGIYLASLLGVPFLLSALSLLVLTLIYTFFLKKIVMADVLTIATLFVIRAAAGALAIDVTISPWLLLGPFFLALFLAVGKRHADLHFLQDEAATTREVLGQYTKETTNGLMLISTTLLIMSYAFYSFLNEYNSLLYTIPFALFVIFRFYHLASSGSSIARHPEKVIKDKAMVIGMLLWLASTATFIYL